MKLVLTLVLTLATAACRAQTSRSTTPLVVQPEVEAEVGLSGGDYLLLGLRGVRLTGDEGPRRLGFDERQLRLGYEHFWNERWSGGATMRLASESAGTEFVPELLLRHRAALGPLTFGQRLSAERTFPDNRGYVGGPGPDGKNFVRLRLDLEKQMPGQGLALRPRLSYELASEVRFQKEETDTRRRTISYGSLRAEVGVRLSPVIDLTPWFAYQTSYIYSLPQYQYDPVTGLLMQTAGGKANTIYPTLGFDLRFLIVSGTKQAERIVLPSQH